MSKGINLSPKHGLNPSLDLCFWCGEAKGVALLGRIHREKGDREDLEAPREMVTSLEPCDKCKEHFAQGVHLIEVCDDGSRFNNDERFALKDSDGGVHWPTGRWAVVNPAAMKNGKAGGKALCGREAMDHIAAELAKVKEKGG